MPFLHHESEGQRRQTISHPLTRPRPSSRFSKVVVSVTFRLSYCAFLCMTYSSGGGGVSFLKEKAKVKKKKSSLFKNKVALK